MPVADDDVDPILLKVLDVVPFRLPLADGAEVARRQLRELPRRPVHPELRATEATEGGLAALRAALHS